MSRLLCSAAVALLALTLSLVPRSVWSQVEGRPGTEALQAQPVPAAAAATAPHAFLVVNTPDAAVHQKIGEALYPVGDFVRSPLAAGAVTRQRAGLAGLAS